MSFISWEAQHIGRHEMNGVITLQGKCLDCGSHNVAEVCLKPNCDGEPIAKGLCNVHYQRQYRNLDAQCSINKCKGPVLARGMCNKHYLRWYRTGNPYMNQQGKRRTLTW